VTITTPTLPAGQVGIAYGPVTLAASGTAPFTWSSVGLPAGLGINAGTGVISGTPTGPAGTSTVTITVTDATTGSGSRTYSLVINP
jgi:hypothetical protein